MSLSLVTRRDSLPATRTSLIGREREVSHWSAELRNSGVRLVTLTGPGGIGKTRLAIAVARQLADAFPDGIGFVALAAVRDSDLVPAAIAASLNVRENGQLSSVDAIVSAINDCACC